MHPICPPFPKSDDRFMTVGRALCERYRFCGLTPIDRRSGEILPALWIGEGAETAVYAAEDDRIGWMLLRFCEDICRAVDEKVPLEGLNIAEILFERRVVILPHFDGATPSGTMCNLCRIIPFRPVMLLRAGRETIGWRGQTHTPKNARMMAAVLAASGGIPAEDAPLGGFADWFVNHSGQPAFCIGIDPEKYAARREMLLLATLL